MPTGIYDRNKSKFNKGIFHKGMILSEKHKKNISQSLKGRLSGMWDKHHSEETKKKISKSMRGKIPKNINLIAGWNKGMSISEKTRKKMSEAKIGKYGSESNSWKGGCSPLRKIIEKSFEYRQWRSDIFTRDNFICQMCNVRGGKLHVHHKKSFVSIIQFYEITTLEEALNCEELWNINNGITLCEECHKKWRIYENSNRNH